MIPSAAAVYCNCSIVEAGSKSGLMTRDTLSPPRDVMPYGELQRLSEFSQTIISEDLNIFWKKRQKIYKTAHATGFIAQSNDVRREKGE